MSWSFTPDEFAHIWREADLDRYPFPLRILETPRTEAEAAALRRTLQARPGLDHDPDLSACLRILADPHTRIVVIGARYDPDHEIRVLGAAVYDRAVLAVQDPGTSPGFGGSVHLSIGHSAKLGARVARQLPDVAAGRAPARSAPAAAVRDDETVVATHPAAPRIRRLLLEPHTSDGHIRIEARRDRASPPPPVHYTWIDVAGDGRYLIRADDEVHIAPAATAQIAAQLQKRIPR